MKALVLLSREAVVMVDVVREPELHIPYAVLEQAPDLPLGMTQWRMRDVHGKESIHRGQGDAVAALLNAATIVVQDAVIAAVLAEPKP